MVAETFDGGRVALKFGNQKINLHEQGKEFGPKADQPFPGSEDLCFITGTKLEVAMEHAKSKGVQIIEGPVARTGATSSIISFCKKQGAFWVLSRPETPDHSSLTYDGFNDK